MARFHEKYSGMLSDGSKKDKEPVAVSWTKTDFSSAIYDGV